MRIATIFLLGTALLAAACGGDSTGPAPVETVLVSPSLLTLNSGATAQLSAQASGRNGSVIDGRPVTWTSSDPSVVQVDAEGRLTAGFVLGANPGRAVVTASVSGVEGSAQVAVEPSVIAEIALAPGAVTLPHGATQQMSAALRDAQGNVLSGRSLGWRVRDTTVARVTQGGLVSTAAFLGSDVRTTYVIAQVGGVIDSVPVTVSPTTVAEIRVSPTKMFLAPTRTRRIRATALSPAGITIPGVAFTFTSSAPAVADVSSTGVVQAGEIGDASVRIVGGGNEVLVPIGVNTCGAGPAGAYPVEVRYLTGTPPAGVQQAFTCAAARIQAAITAPPPAPVPYLNFNAGGCATGLVLNESVNGLLILASIEPIDGVGSVLGSAGPCFLRGDDGLPNVGRMRFDVADLNNLEQSGRLADVIIHEMLHVIGVGTVWSGKGFLIGVGSTPIFTGPLATQSCIADHAGSGVCGQGVLVESCVGIPGCGGGTINSHWREPVFTNELMTGYLNNSFNPFSRMSIQSLADIGYGVDVETADDYSLLPGAALQAESGPALKMPEPLLPTHIIDRWGRATPLPRR